jgi:hypothetical protein
MLSTIVNSVNECERWLRSEDTVTDPSGGNESAGGYAAQLDALRSVVKWLVAAFAGAGALLVGGLQISGIGQLSPSSWRLYVAACAAGLALAGVGYMIKEASVVLTQEWLTLASLGDEATGPVLRPRQQTDWWSARLREIDEKVVLSRHELFGYAVETRGQLHRRLRLADERGWQSEPGSETEIGAAKESAMLRKAARDTVQYANYCLTLKLFQRMRIRLGWASAIVATCVVIFAYAANPPKHPAPTPVTIVSMGRLYVTLASPSTHSLSAPQNGRQRLNNAPSQLATGSGR